jgi:Protein of unknown function (DUF2752)
MAVRFADPRSAEPLRRSGEAATLGLAGAAAAALSIACAVSPARVESGPIVCPFRLATGLPCPGCGLTRSWVFIAHGDFAAAVGANPFGFVTMAAAVALIAVVATSVVRGRPIPSRSPVVRSRPFLALLAVWLVFACVRIVVVATS